MFCGSVRKYAKNIIAFEKKKMLPKEELKSSQEAIIFEKK